MCLTEASGLLMLSVCKINAPLVGSGCEGEGNARGQGQLTLRPVRMGIRHHEQGIAFPSKNIFSFQQKHTMCVQNKTNSL
jgi:hypothetical protein